MVCEVQGGQVFLHKSNLGGFGPGSMVRCSVYYHNGKPQARNLQAANEAETAELMEMIAAGSMTGAAGAQSNLDTSLGTYSGTVRISFTFNFEEVQG